MISIYEQACEKAIAHCGKNLEIRLTGSLYGLSFKEWDALIRAALKELMYSTPRCLRLRKWDVNVRIA